MAKNFDNINTGRVYTTINEATAQAAPETQEDTEKQQERKERRTYTEQEALDYGKLLQTSGRKGVKLPRINLAFAPDVHEYITTMARARGQNLTQFVDVVMREHMEQHRELYEKAIEFRKSL